VSGLDNSHNDKIMPMSEAVNRFVKDGDTVAIANFISPIAYGALHEIIRQKKRRLTAVIASSIFELDLWAGSGCLKKVIYSYHTRLRAGERVFDRAVRNYKIKVEDYTNYTMCAMFAAGAMNLPFMAAKKSILVTDLYRKGSEKFKVIDNPFNAGEEVVLVPAIHPDVALVHVQRVDRNGNAQSWGATGTTKHAALASKRIIVSAEELVEDDVVSHSPNNTLIPGFRVDAICIEPWGSHPVDCLGYYDADYNSLALFLATTTTEEGFRQWLDEWVFGCQDRAKYIEHYADKFGDGALQRLRAKSRPSYPVNLGSNLISQIEDLGITQELMDSAADLFEVEVE